MRFFQRKYLGWTIGAIVVSVIIALPLFFVLDGFSDANNPNVLHIREYLLSDMVATTLRMILGTGTVALLLGVPSAYFVANYQFPLRGLLKKMNVLPAAVPTYIMAFAYASIFSITGTFQKIAEVFFTRETVFSWNIDVINEGFLMVFLGFALYPYVYSASLVSFSIKNKAMEEVAASLGAHGLKRFFRVMLPLSAAAIMGGFALVAMEVLNDYGAMSYFNVRTITAGIFQAKQMDFTSSLYLSALTFSAVVSIFAGYYLIRSVKKVSVVSATLNYDLQSLTKWKALGVSLWVFLPFFLGFILPVIELILLAGSKVNVIFSTDFFTVLFNSIQLAIIPAFIIVLFSVVLLYNDYLNPTRWGSVFSTLSTVGYAIPGAVIAIAVISFILFFDDSDKSTYHFLINSLVLLIFAYVVRFMAVGYNTLYGGFSQISASIPNASRGLGKGSLFTLFKVYFPLLKGAVFTAFAIVMVDVLKELPLTLLLQRFNFDTLATITYEQAKINESVSDAAPYALLLIFAGALVIIGLLRSGEKR